MVGSPLMEPPYDGLQPSRSKSTFFALRTNSAKRATQFNDSNPMKILFIRVSGSRGPISDTNEAGWMGSLSHEKIMCSGVSVTPETLHTVRTGFLPHWFSCENTAGNSRSQKQLGHVVTHLAKLPLYSRIDVLDQSNCPLTTCPCLSAGLEVGKGAGLRFSGDWLSVTITSPKIDWLTRTHQEMYEYDASNNHDCMFWYRVVSRSYLNGNWPPTRNSLFL